MSLEVHILSRAFLATSSQSHGFSNTCTGILSAMSACSWQSQRNDRSFQTWNDINVFRHENTFLKDKKQNKIKPWTASWSGRAQLLATTLCASGLRDPQRAVLGQSSRCWSACTHQKRRTVSLHNFSSRKRRLSWPLLTFLLQLTCKQTTAPNRRHQQKEQGGQWRGPGMSLTTPSHSSWYRVWADFF